MISRRLNVKLDILSFEIVGIITIFSRRFGTQDDVGTPPLCSLASWAADRRIHIEKCPKIEQQ